ncbi:MAG: hypothetical protein AB7O37_14860 [Vicinamibacteria bacterium]
MTGEVVGLALAMVVAYPLGLALGQPWLLPILNTAPAYVLMLRRLRRGDRRGAVRLMLAWAVALAVIGTVFFALWPSDPGPIVLAGPAYREEMFRWIATGLGSEGDPRLFLPQHVAHLAGFVALSLATASSLSILLGAVLMNYMDYYVASLARAGAPAWAALFLGWQPWAICRVAAFCTLGVVLAEPLLAALGRCARPSLRDLRPWLAAAAAGILADWVLKALLAPMWGLWLRALLPAR